MQGRKNDRAQIDIKGSLKILIEKRGKLMGGGGGCFFPPKR